MCKGITSGMWIPFHELQPSDSYLVHVHGMIETLLIIIIISSVHRNIVSYTLVRHKLLPVFYASADSTLMELVLFQRTEQIKQYIFCR